MLAYINPQTEAPKAVSLFTRAGCPHCARAKALLQEHGMSYEEIELSQTISSRSLHAITGADTVPQIYVGGAHIGGADDLETWFTAKHAA